MQNLLYAIKIQINNKTFDYLSYEKPHKTQITFSMLFLYDVINSTCQLANYISIHCIVH